MINIDWKTGRASFSKHPNTRLEIHWDDGVISQVRRKGSMWDWGRDGAQSSRLDGITDQLAANTKWGVPSGTLKRVSNRK